jgi:hypothetical protein
MPCINGGYSWIQSVKQVWKYPDSLSDYRLVMFLLMEENIQAEISILRNCQRFGLYLNN